MAGCVGIDEPNAYGPADKPAVTVPQRQYTFFTSGPGEHPALWADDPPEPTPVVPEDEHY